MDHRSRTSKTSRSGCIAATLVSLAAAAALMACGGGGSESTSQPTETAARAKALAAHPIYAALPGDPDWATEEPCTDPADFIAVDGLSDYDMPLKSRHTYCLLLSAPPQPVSVDLMRNADDTGWEYYNPSAGRPATSFLVGTLELKTQFQSFGPDNGLYKTHRMTFIVSSFVPDSGFPLPAGSYTLKLSPRIDCYQMAAGNGASNGRCSNTDQFSVSLPLQPGAEAVTPDVQVGFAWDFSAGDGNYDWASFKVELNKAVYTVNEIPRPSGADPFLLSTDNSSGSMVPVAQEIRCDRVLSSGGACVMPKAAAVVVMDTAADPVLQEVADHIYDAQHTLSPGQTVLSPGLFALKPGTRAVADESGGSQYQGLQREMDKAKQDANRAAAYENNDSLFKTRPFQGSASCPVDKTPGCSIDEYSFAASKSGAAYSPESTSVRTILETSNSKGGIVFSSTMAKQRVLPPEVYPDKFWVVKR